MQLDTAEQLAIQLLLARFANSFDLKDWDALGDCLCDTLHTDYSALRGTPPETLTRERFVELRRTALHALRTHHLSGNIEIEGEAPDCARARVSTVIYRRDDQDRTLNTHCLYHFGLRKEADGCWRLDRIVQQVFWSEGQKALHAGILPRVDEH